MVGYSRKILVALVGALSLVGMAAATAAAEPRDTLVEFDSMTPIGTGAPTERNLAGGGFPWAIRSGMGSVDRQGDVHVRVTGLVLATGAPPLLVGTNPLPKFAATVSCLTPGGVMNVTTDTAPATSGGDSTINATVALPHPCKSPEVFVGAIIGGQFRWFAVSNAEDRD